MRCERGKWLKVHRHVPTHKLVGQLYSKHAMSEVFSKEEARKLCAFIWNLRQRLSRTLARTFLCQLLFC